jgi:hypothetical protein
MCSEQQEEAKSLASERLALLALGSHVSMSSDSGSTTTGDRPRASRFAAVDPSYTPPAAASQPNNSGALASLQAAMAMPAAVTAQGQSIPAESQSSVFGPALPGLVICGAAGKAYDAYAVLRDAVVRNMQQRIMADAAMITLIATAVLALSAASP